MNWLGAVRGCCALKTDDLERFRRMPDWASQIHGRTESDRAASGEKHLSWLLLSHIIISLCWMKVSTPAAATGWESSGSSRTGDVGVKQVPEPSKRAVREREPDFL